MELSNLNIKEGLCISLGANIDSKFGNPIESLLRCKPIVENIILETVITNINLDPKQEVFKSIFNWSSLYQTSPVGIKDFQQDYINCLVLAKSKFIQSPSLEKAKELLEAFKNLEIEFGRIKSSKENRWQPRELDLDILWWDNLYINEKELSIPHPRFNTRNFVITPLSEVLARTQKIKKLYNPKWIIN